MAYKLFIYLLVGIIILTHLKNRKRVREHSEKFLSTATVVLSICGGISVYHDNLLWANIISILFIASIWMPYPIEVIKGKFKKLLIILLIFSSIIPIVSPVPYLKTTSIIAIITIVVTIVLTMFPIWIKEIDLSNSLWAPNVPLH